MQRREQGPRTSSYCPSASRISDARAHQSGRVAALRGDTKYTPVDGSRLLKDAIVAKSSSATTASVQRPQQVLVSTGAKQTYYNAACAL